MAVFTYNPDEVSTWSNGVASILNGGSDSVAECSKKFGEQINKLVQEDVWTGAAALKNYNDFTETHKAMVSFVDSFGDAFAEAMKSVSSSVANLESTNAISSSSISLSLDYTHLQAVADQNITTDYVRYNYAVITEISSQLASIKGTLEGVKQKLVNKIGEIGADSTIWGGNAADAAVESLTSTLETGMKEVFEGLDTCISNIAQAAENAANLDTAA